MKITPVLIVEEIENLLPFWMERMGFEKIAEVPHGDRLGFIMLVRDDAELMFQTVESVRADAPQFAPQSPSTNASLFIETGDLEDIIQRLKGYPVALPERTTFYGMREVGVFDPGGNIVVFAVRT